MAKFPKHRFSDSEWSSLRTKVLRLRKKRKLVAEIAPLLKLTEREVRRLIRGKKQGGKFDAVPRVDQLERIIQLHKAGYSVPQIGRILRLKQTAVIRELLKLHPDSWLVSGVRQRENFRSVSEVAR